MRVYQTVLSKGLAMENWNYESAKNFVEAIDNEVTKTITSTFLNEAVAVSLQRTAAPEKDFDLLFFVRVVSRIAGDHKLLRMCLNGDVLDAGWEGVAEAFSESTKGRKTRGQT